MTLSSVNDEAIIRLNVGGNSFSTLYRTLYQSTYFQNLLEGVMENKTTTSDGAVFIDRDANLFRDVLLYLRTSTIFTRNYHKLHCLLLEAQFYQIDEMEQQAVNLIELQAVAFIAREE
ncbi:hypothetical protein MAM1_0071c04158 [Mucor ambiguus]|uniref:BTB domain-containing protein n=1 Tax=Mucor ambiguus TaxID=91626 RepID=A0A0C9MBK9_9FUNG|nr:hypothetical protein MAM1_0071c04158 [Mucor ambiguus]